MTDEDYFKKKADFVKTEDSYDGDIKESGAAGLMPRRANTKTKKTTSAPRKLQHQWKHKEIVHLISLVEQHRGLWDVGSVEYKMSRWKGWREVVDALNVKSIDVNEAKLKWMNLRLAFKTNMGKLRAKNSGQDANKSVSITWKFFPLLKFLETKDVAQSTESVLTIASANTTTDQSILNEIAIDQSLPALPTVGLHHKRRDTPLSMLTPPASLTPSLSSSTSITKQMATQVLSGELLTPDRCEKHAIFGDFVASELRSLPPHESDALRMSLMRTILTFLENRQPAVSPEPKN